ncbi:type III effector protein [Streptomyces sp. NPDC047108]|uniref:type III effector protein n=1 Tax=Streptomyces sp. NPDC047108 TaxID=3155025 RepID=UPI003409B140
MLETDCNATPEQGPAPAVPTANQALIDIAEVVRTAHATHVGGARTDDSGDQAEQALAALSLLREVRESLASWESGLIEAAREAGVSWAQLAHPLGVASRQAAERRYLRLRPGAAGSTGEQRIQDTRDRRAADRSVDDWARRHAADLRRLAGQITALSDLPTSARTPVGDLDHALAADDAAGLVGPLADTHQHLQDSHPDLAARIDGVNRHTHQIRRESNDQRRSTD